MMDKAQIDAITNSGGQLVAAGTVAQRMLASGFNTNSMRTCGVLQKDEWKAIDNAVLGVARTRLQAFEPLLSRGLRTDIPNGLGHTQIEWETSSDMTSAEVNMSGVTEGQRDRIVYATEAMPLPIIHKGFNINIRALQASRNKGLPLDTTQAQIAGRKVAEKVESILFAGAGLTVGSGVVYGLETHPQRNTGALTANWDGTATGEQIVGDVLSMIDALQAKNMYGPYGIYISEANYNRLGEDYKANSDKTILTRLMEIPSLAFIQPTSTITANNVIMLQLTQDVIDIIVGMQPTTLQWETDGGMVVHFRVMSIMVPRIRKDQLNQCGIAHYT